MYPPDPVNEFDLTGLCPMCVYGAYILGGVAVKATLSYAAKKQAAKIAAQQAAKYAAQQAAKKAAAQATKKSWRKVSDSYLKQKGIDAHALKKEFGVGSRADLFVDKKSGQIYVRLKDGTGEAQPTYKYIK